MNMNRIMVKLGATIILLFLIVLLPLGYVINQIFYGFYYKQVQSQIEQLASRYSDEIASSHSTATVNMIEMMSAFSEVKMIVIGADGKIMANSGVSWIPERMSAPEIELEQLQRGKPIKGEMNNPESKERFLASAQPIIAGDNYYGAVYVLSSVDAIVSSLQRVRQMLVLSGIGVFFLALGATFMLSRRLSDPLIRMEKVTRRIAKGELDIKVRIHSNDEIGSLAKAINDLAVDLRRYRDTRREFFANISHELRTPMTYLEGYTKVLTDKLYETDEERDHYLGIIHQESVRLTRLINDLFELSKMEEGKVSLQFEQLDLSEIVHHVIQKVKTQAKLKNLELRAHLPERLPFVYADGFRMEQVLMNLLDNAIRYTDHGMIQISIKQTHPESVSMIIEDTGAGISEEEVPYIFDRFYRVEKSRSKEHGGTGLGLAIVKQLVELQGGTIQISSVLGKGTRFEITIPKGRTTHEVD